MNLSNRTIREASCPLRSECRAESDRRFFKRLFAEDWDELVIRPNARTGEYESRLQTHANNPRPASHS